jgi:hypothetical protein
MGDLMERRNPLTSARSVRGQLAEGNLGPRIERGCPITAAEDTFDCSFGATDIHAAKGARNLEPRLSAMTDLFILMFRPDEESAVGSDPQTGGRR